MPGDHWSDYIDEPPDSARWQHYRREEELEEEIEIQREILAEMRREINAVIRRGDGEISEIRERIREQIRTIEDRRVYRDAQNRLSALDIELEDHVRESHGSYHSVVARGRRPRPNILSEEQADAQSRTPSRRRSRQQSPRSSILPSITGTPQNVAPPTSPVGLPSPPAVNRSNFARLQHSPGSRFSPIGTPPRSGRRNGNRHTRSSENRENRARLAREGSGSNTPSTPTRRLRFGTETYQPQLKF